MVVTSLTCVIGAPSSLIRHACVRLAGIYLSVILLSPLVSSGEPSEKNHREILGKTSHRDVSTGCNGIPKVPRAFFCRDVPVERLQKVLNETPANYLQE